MVLAGKVIKIIIQLASYNYSKIQIVTKTLPSFQHRLNDFDQTYFVNFGQLQKAINIINLNI